MKYVVKMGSGVMINAQSFIKIGSGTQKLTMSDSQTPRQHGDLIRLLFQNKESRLNMEYEGKWEEYN
jgi:hypothetical protein